MFVFLLSFISCKEKLLEKLKDLERLHSGSCTLTAQKEFDKVRGCVNIMTPELPASEKLALGKTKHQLLRVVAPLSLLMECIDHYNVDAYQLRAAISTPLECLTQTTVWRLQGNTAQQGSLFKMAIGVPLKYIDGAGQTQFRQTAHCQIKQLEYGLDYDTILKRCEFKNVKQPDLQTKPEKKAAHDGLIRDFMMSWKKFLITEKTRQFNEKDRWPSKDFMPWKPDSVMQMPVVLWIRHESKTKRK